MPKNGVSGRAGGGAELNCPYELVFDNGLRPDELVNWTEKEKVNEELQCK